ncbi:MAG: haloacid dehalogenase-like hydrolase, partial [Bacteroidales bacterium]|nr:haloacid dehalogenase-like hydrolase [Bacteroidales bacterium]
MSRKPIVALIYDFDGTLSPGNMQEFGFIQAVGSTPEEFGKMSDCVAKGEGGWNVLADMRLMFEGARRWGVQLRRE